MYASRKYQGQCEKIPFIDLGSRKCFCPTVNDLATRSAHLENNPSFAVWKKKASPGSYPRDINFSRLDKADTFLVAGKLKLCPKSSALQRQLSFC